MKRQLLLIFIVLSGCSTYRYSAEYNFNLDKVEHNGGKIADTEPILHFKDSLIDITWTLKPQSFKFELSNLSDNSLQILWDQAAIADENGISKKVFHEGIAPEDAAKSQPPSTVLKGSRLIDAVYSAHNLTFIPGTQDRKPSWNVEHIYFNPSGKDEEIVKAEANKYVGTVIRMSLPVMKGDKVHEYVFHFRKRDVNMQSVREPDPIANLGLVLLISVMVLAVIYP